MNYKRKNNDSECDMYRRIIVELVEKIEDKDVLEIKKQMKEIVSNIIMTAEL